MSRTIMTKTHNDVSQDNYEGTKEYKSKHMVVE
jgi:hypothetical protein